MRTTIIFVVFGSIQLLDAESPAQVQEAAKALSDLARICQHDGKVLWSESLCGPVILVNPSTGASIANRADPGGKFQKQEDVYVGAMPEQFTPSNTAVEWQGERWTTVMLPLPADPFNRLALLAHESFHRIQPGIGLSAPDTPSAHLDSENGRLWPRMEVRALARALRTPGSAGRVSASDAMLFRTYRHALYAGSEAMEAAMEKQEGLAAYTGAFIALQETGENIMREARIVEAFEDGDTFARSFAYVTGPALGMLLDRFAPGWRKRASSASLDSMLVSALHLRGPLDVGPYARLRAAHYGYPAVAAAEREREIRHKTFLKTLTQTFIDRPTLDFPSAPDMSRNFDPFALVSVPPYGIYYPAGTFRASWGKLEVESGGALVSPDNRSIRVTPPLDVNSRPVRGEGWLLHIAPGWAIRPSAQPGGFVLVPD